MTDPTHKLQREIEQTRSHLDVTLDAIQQKVANPGLAAEVLGYDKYRGMARDLFQVIRRNPAPAVLIAAGLGWLLYGARKGTTRKGQVSAVGPHTSRVHVAPPSPTTTAPAAEPPIMSDPDLGVPPRF